ncbi:MAG: NAD-dependent aldehyde dehydrogenase [Planctomycetota bacterium]|nr:NAD-dependent aldehyde dehydrogenase [Planctomycetota bacterium]
MATVDREPLIACNPATGREIARIEGTAPADVALLVAGARDAQEAWATTPIRHRIEVIQRFWSILSRDSDTMARAIRDEIGKPLPEARFEMIATLDAIRWTVKNARGFLADERIGAGWQRAALMKPAVVRWRPLGVVGIIGTWNYPVLLDASAIVQAIVAGNGVAWKSSEHCPLVASHLRDRFHEAGVPVNLIASLFGGGDVGQAMIETRNLAKGFFTGGVETGRRVLTAFSEHLVPAVMELSGFDPAVVLPDAPFDSTVSALTWAAFVGAGQTCVAVKRIYVVGDARPWAEAISQRARALRVGDPATGSVDMGPMISERARAEFHARIHDAVAAGAELLCGGEPIDGPGWFYRPTVLFDDERGTEAHLEGIFGPVVIVQSMDSDDMAVSLSNYWSYGLAASVWGRDLKRCRAIADRLEAGMVTINDAVTPSGLAAAPFGGTKSSGFGRVRGAIGLREFVEAQTLHERRPGGFRPHLFPYSDRLGKILALYQRLFHPRA